MKKKIKIITTLQHLLAGAQDSDQNDYIYLNGVMAYKASIADRQQLCCCLPSLAERYADSCIEKSRARVEGQLEQLQNHPLGFTKIAGAIELDRL